MPLYMMFHVPFRRTSQAVNVTAGVRKPRQAYHRTTIPSDVDEYITSSVYAGSERETEP